MTCSLYFYGCLQRVAGACPPCTREDVMGVCGAYLGCVYHGRKGRLVEMIWLSFKDVRLHMAGLWIPMR